MLKIHKSHSKKLLLIPITLICITFGLLGFYYLTYIPELSHAETVTYDPIPRYHPNISDITFMQDMTEEVCQNSYENDAKQLIDKRDSKTYWVAKLKDGNCWMTQNLDLDLYVNGAGRKLTSADSDVTSDWISTTEASVLWSGNSSNYNIVRYYNPGEYVYTTPTIQNNCGSSTGLTGCTSQGWQSTSGMSVSNDPNFASVVSGNTYNAHYLAGNYYSWGAATAGQATNLTIDLPGEQATQSICSRGWRLPLSGNKTASGSFYYLLDQYGLTNNASNVTTGFDIYSVPLYFLYGGGVDTSKLKNAGSNGVYWSSTASYAFGASCLSFATGVNPSIAGFRYNGHSVRCVARGEAVVRPEVPSVDNVTININPQISLDVADEVAVEKSETNPSTADLEVKVSSNQSYAVNINAKEHAELTSENGDKIPSNGGALTAAENNWGIMKPGDMTYTKVTTTPQLFYQATSAEAKDILFKVGISTAPDLANGTYATDIVITATQN